MIGAIIKTKQFRCELEVMDKIYFNQETHYLTIDTKKGHIRIISPQQIKSVKTINEHIVQVKIPIVDPDKIDKLC